MNEWIHAWIIKWINEWIWICKWMNWKDGRRKCKKPLDMFLWFISRGWIGWWLMWLPKSLFPRSLEQVFHSYIQISSWTGNGGVTFFCWLPRDTIKNPWIALVLITLTYTYVLHYKLLNHLYLMAWKTRCEALRCSYGSICFVNR